MAREQLLSPWALSPWALPLLFGEALYHDQGVERVFRLLKGFVYHD